MKLELNNNHLTGKSLSKNWFLLSIASLAFSGLFAIFLVIGRSPYINKILPHVDFFKTSLTIHVNLSVTVWLIGIICCIQFLQLTQKRFAYIICFWTSAFGSLLIAFSIFDPSATAYLNNYIPFIESLTFEIGIFMFLIGALISNLLALAEGLKFKSTNLIAFPSLIILSSIVFFTALYQLEILGLKELFNSEDYFENLFWGSGHIIQLAYAQLVIFAWLIIIGKLANKDYSSHYKISTIINLVCAFIGIFIIFLHPISEVEYRTLYTKHMIYFSGLSSLYIFFFTIKDFLKICIKKFDGDKLKTIKNCLVWSIILYASGGLIGLNINEINTVIPAHYHGSIVAISLGGMGMCYTLLEYYGYGYKFSRLTKIQPVLYGAGQLLHITGFAISGGYGALRKSPGTLNSIEGKFYMGLMGLGGLISIIGGLIFIIVIFRAINNKKV